jgi:hypothetical protein
MTGEVLIDFSRLQREIYRVVPQSQQAVLADDKGVGLKLTIDIQLRQCTVTIVPPSSIAIGASYTTDLGFIGVLQPGINTTITFGASNGNVTAFTDYLNTGDLGIPGTILPSLVNPFEMTALIFSLIGLGWYAISNLGGPAANAWAPIPAPQIDPSSLLPRQILADFFKVLLSYRPPSFLTRGMSAGMATGTPTNPGPVVGATPGLQALTIPFAWETGSRQPSVSIRGPTQINLVDGVGDITYHAITVDLQDTEFAWTLDGVALPGKTRATEVIRLDMNSRRTGVQRTFVVGVEAVDGAGPAFSASARTSTRATVIRDVEREGPRE